MTVPMIAWSHREHPNVFAPCASIRRPERCRHVRLVFSGHER